MLSRYHTPCLPGTMHSRYRQLSDVTDTMHSGYHAPCIQVPCLPGIVSSQTFPFISGTMQHAFQVLCIPDTKHSRCHALCIPGTLPSRYRQLLDFSRYHAFQVPRTKRSRYHAFQVSSALRLLQIPCIPGTTHHAFQVPCIPGIVSSQTFPLRIRSHI